MVQKRSVKKREISDPDDTTRYSYPPHFIEHLSRQLRTNEQFEQHPLWKSTDGDVVWTEVAKELNKHAGPEDKLISDETIKAHLQSGKTEATKRVMDALSNLILRKDAESWIRENMPDERILLAPARRSSAPQQALAIAYPELSLQDAVTGIIKHAKSEFALMVVTCGDVLKNCSTHFIKALERGVSVRIVLLDPCAEAKVIQAFSETIGHSPTLVNDECRHSVQWAILLMKQWLRSKKFDPNKLRIYLTQLPARMRLVYADPTSKKGVAIVFPSMNMSGQIPMPAFKTIGNAANVPGAYRESLERFIATARPITDYLEELLPNDEAITAGSRDLIDAYAQDSSEEK